MKTERRHELQTNWLADRVGDVLLVMKPYLKGLAGVLLAVLVVWVAILYMAHRTEHEEVVGWNKLWDGLLGGPKAGEDLATLSESSPKRPTSEWALLILADNDLGNGVGSLFTEKAVGRNLIKTALDNYQTVLKNSTDPLVREHALFGVGRSQESLCNLQDAQTAYKQLRDDYPNGSYSARAQERFDDLARDSTRARYDWFKNIEPPPNVFGKGSDKTGDKSGLQLSPELEPFSQFAAPASKTPPPEPKPDTGATAPQASKPSDAKPPATKAPDAKAPEKSKAGDKAAETTPAIPKPADTKAPDTKATDTPASKKPTADSAPPASTPIVPKPDDSKSTPPKPADSKS
jgi:hypothetical protein